jgi:hypothetical protein
LLPAARCVADIDAIGENAAARGLEQAEQQIGERRLSRPFGPATPMASPARMRSSDVRTAAAP